MDIYDATSYKTSALLTNAYSTSFGSASRLFSKPLRPHIYAIYGFSRLGDEVVDTYTGPHAAHILDQYHQQTHEAIAQAYSTNPLLHAFQKTVNAYNIDPKLIDAFFTSMRMDLEPQETYTQEQYETYIYGSAEVIGLMCLYVFVDGDPQHYAKLAKGAAHLGAALQKINFLRDFAADTNDLKRSYFPGVDPKQFTEADKHAIIEDIRGDLAQALPALRALPKSSRAAVMVSYRYFEVLLHKLERTSAHGIMQRRIRVPDARKLWILCTTVVQEKL